MTLRREQSPQDVPLSDGATPLLSSLFDLRDDGGGGGGDGGVWAAVAGGRGLGGGADEGAEGEFDLGTWKCHVAMSACETDPAFASMVEVH